MFQPTTDQYLLFWHFVQHVSANHQAQKTIIYKRRIPNSCSFHKRRHELCPLDCVYRKTVSDNHQIQTKMIYKHRIPNSCNFDKRQHTRCPLDCVYRKTRF